MKSALVLGLALAANGMAADQADNELIIAPYGKYEHDIAQRFPVKIMYDEQADDELGLKIVHLPIAETMAYDDDELAIRQQVIYGHLESLAADDELSFMPIPPKVFVNRDWAKIPTTEGLIRDDEADDELAVRNPTPEQYQRLQNKSLLYKSAEEADDQLWDEAADDEFAIKYVHLPVAPVPEIAAYDDDEFAAALAPRSAFKTDQEYEHYLYRIRIAWDDAADDELSLMPMGPHVFINKQWFKPTKTPATEALIRDDEADDELAYLGQLIRDGGYIPRLYADDELRVEKPSHIKAEERAQFKSDLPKKQRKFRPHPDVIPMAEN